MSFLSGLKAFAATIKSEIVLLRDAIGATYLLFESLADEVDARHEMPFIKSPGVYIDQSITAETSSTIAGVANRVVMSPWAPSVTLTIDEIGVGITAGVAAAKGRVCVYESDADGRPTNLIFQTGELNFAAAGPKLEAAGLTFAAGRVYWLGVHSSSTATIRAIITRSTRAIGVAGGGNGASYFTAIQRTVPFGALPSVWGFLASEMVSVNPPSVRMRLQ